MFCSRLSEQADRL